MALKYFVPMSAVFMLVSITFSPNNLFIKLACDHECFASLRLIRSAPDLSAGTLADWFASRRQVLQLHFLQAANHQHTSSVFHVQGVNSDSPDDKATVA